MERPLSKWIGCRFLIISSQLIRLSGIKKGARIDAPFLFWIGDF